MHLMAVLLLLCCLFCAPWIDVALVTVVVFFVVVLLVLFLCFEQLRKVKSTVHLTGKPTEETKEALKRLLQPSLKNVSYQ